MADIYTIPRRLVTAEWNEFVDAHPSGWWWHRNEWLDYSMSYGNMDGVVSTDLSVALYDGKIIHGIFPFIGEKCEAGRRAAMGGTPCAGPLLAKSYDGDAQHAVEVINSHTSIMRRPRAWRWSYRNDHVEELVDVLQRWDMARAGWQTKVVNVDRPESERWTDLRKSYRSIIKKANATYDIDWSDDFTAYKRTHQHATDNCRISSLTYWKQRKWMESGFAKIVTAKERGVGNAGESVTPAPLQRVTGGASPPSSTTVAAAYVIQYKDRAYYASGPSVRDNVQAACLWEAMQVVRVPQFEVGWVAEPDGSPSIEFFKSGFGGEVEPVLVLQTDQW